MGDKVDAAIAATEAAPKVEVVNLTITLSTGRPIAIAVPSDMTTREALDAIDFFASGLGPELERRRAGPRPRLLVPAHAARPT